MDGDHGMGSGDTGMGVKVVVVGVKVVVSRCLIVVRFRIHPPFPYLLTLSACPVLLTLIFFGLSTCVVSVTVTVLGRSEEGFMCIPCQVHVRDCGRLWFGWYRIGLPHTDI